ncbi:hypothetical protein GOBAR_AA10630 [Gossypium barbadense]|uniref:Arabidopsis retrotransposon Orf1 C-terminal domain-containing protein n=1 Tax=Gossypium barbadense TaxID=3634 RepID=A0A2P5Y340_GOSBA|nr:hypothetical protein GOBAR_AA10630 [Gossypium barbadense]
MTNTRGKSNVTVPASKKQKGSSGTSSSSASVEARHPYLRFSGGLQENLYQLLRVRPLGPGRYIDWAVLKQARLTDDVRIIITTALWDRFFAIIEPTYMELTLEFFSTFLVQRVMIVHDEPGTVTFFLSGLVRQMSVPEFDAAMRLYTEKFMSAVDFLRLHRHIHHLPSCCWTDLTPYDPSHSKVTSLSPVLRYIHAILAHTLKGQGESIGVEEPHLSRPLRDSSCSTLQSPRHTRAVVDQMSPQGISSMIYMRIIKRRCGVDPPQYRLFHSDAQNESEDFTDDVPPYHKDPPQPPPSSHRPVPSAASFQEVSSEEFIGFRHTVFRGSIVLMRHCSRFVSISIFLL